MKAFARIGFTPRNGGSSKIPTFQSLTTIGRGVQSTRLPSITTKLPFDAEAANASLPEGSPFADWRTARQFAGPMPFTFSPEADGRFVVIEGRRAEWVPRPVRILKWDVSLFRESPLRDVEPILANAFAVENVNYRWEKGRIVKPGAAP